MQAFLSIELFRQIFGAKKTRIKYLKSMFCRLFNKAFALAH